MKRWGKWKANVHHHAYRAELAFLRRDKETQNKHLARLAKLVPETHEETNEFRNIVEKAIRQAHADFRESTE